MYYWHDFVIFRYYYSKLQLPCFAVGESDLLLLGGSDIGVDLRILERVFFFLDTIHNYTAKHAMKMH